MPTHHSWLQRGSAISLKVSPMSLKSTALSNNYSTTVIDWFFGQWWKNKCTYTRPWHWRKVGKLTTVSLCHATISSTSIWLPLEWIKWIQPMHVWVVCFKQRRDWVHDAPSFYWFPVMLWSSDLEGSGNRADTSTAQQKMHSWITAEAAVPQKSGGSHSTLQIKEELWQGSFPLLEMTDIPHAASPAKDLSLSLMCSSCLLTICCGHGNTNDFFSYFAMHRSIQIYSAVCLSRQLSYICIKPPTAIEPEGLLCKTDRTEVLVDLRDEGTEEQRWAGCNTGYNTASSRSPTIVQVCWACFASSVGHNSTAELQQIIYTVLCKFKCDGTIRAEAHTAFVISFSGCML